MTENKKFTLYLFISVILSCVAFYMFPLEIYEPPQYIEFNKDISEKQQVGAIANDIANENKIKKGTKAYKKELQNRINQKREDYFNKVKSILKEDVTANEFWGECSGNNCTQLSLKQLLDLDEYARNNSDFATDVCMWALTDPSKYKFVSPEYKPDLVNNRCELIGYSGNREVVIAFYLIKIMCSFIVGYLFLVFVTIIHYREKNKDNSNPNTPMII